MGGKKRKIQIEKIEEKTVKSVAFTKRRNCLFRKASKLCDLSPSTQIAILATPISTNSHTSFYTFGYPSADEVVYSFLYNHSPSILPKNSLRRQLSEDVDELKEAVDVVSTMLNKVKLRLDEAVKSTTQEEKLLVTESNQIPKFEGKTSASASNF